MTVEEIHRAFQAAVASGALSTDTALRGLGELLASLAVDSLPVDGGTASSGPQSALLTGSTSYLNTTWTMRLTGTPEAGTDRAALVLGLTGTTSADPWTLEAAFGELPESRRLSEGGKGGLLLGPSVVGPLVLDRPVLTAGNVPPDARPRLSGTLLVLGTPTKPESGLLADYAPFLGEHLLVEGPLAFPSGKPPVIELCAATPRLPLKLGELEVSAVGLILTTEYPDPYPIPQPGAHRSAALLFAELTLPTTPVQTATVSCALLSGDYVWPLLVALEPPLGLQGAVQALIAITGAPGEGFTLPPGIAPLDRFRLQDVGFGIVPVALGGPALSSSSVSIVSGEPWDPPVPFLMIDQVGVRWQFALASGRVVDHSGMVFGTMRFGQKSVSAPGAHTVPDIIVTVRMSLPELEFSAIAEEPFDLPIAEVLRVFFGSGGPPIEGEPLTCESLSMRASLPQKRFAAELSVRGEWRVRAGQVGFALTGLHLQVEVSPNAVSGLIVGKGEITVGDPVDPTTQEYPPIELSAQARYPGSGAWEFTAGMVGTVDLPQLVHALMGTQPPPWVRRMEIQLTDLTLWFSTAGGKPYTASGALRVAVAEELLGMALELALTARIKRSLRATPAAEQPTVALRDTGQVEPQTVLTGSLSGAFAINRLTVTASVSVAGPEKDYTFELAYGGVSLRAATAWTGEGSERHRILTARLTGTLGELLTALVALANPNATFRIDPPWSFLTGIDLSGLSLTVDPTGQAVAVDHDLRLDLGFVKIKKVGLRYDRSGGTPAVTIVLDAQLLGDDRAKPLSWDPVTQAPPQPPGLGQKLFALRYLGLGQHVSPRKLTRYTGIAEVVDAMVAAMRPVEQVTGKPPIDPATMVFDAAGQWLFGIDATIMNTVAVKLVMHDPDLYGILLALNGPQAGSLAGLSVELLYKKVTDDIGVFHARLQIPDGYRQLQFGAVSVTLGVITVDIFTNGNFRVDLGFPTGGDFTNSFAIEAGYFNGRGGIHFGVLNGATSGRVPKITNGTFSPVLELGVGLSIGVGRTFQRGALSAGLYVNLVVIFEGALAWFHPDEGGRSTELYYWCRGTVGIVGRLYGTVDFKVIRVDVNLQVSAMATVELAAYRATVIWLNLSVRANASVKIAFIRIKFSFSLTLQTSFEIGSNGTPPWRVAPGSATRTLAAVRNPEPADHRLHFDPDAHVFPAGEVKTAHLSLVPAYTIANVPVDWTGRQPPPNEQPDHRLVVMLTADNAVPVDAVTIAECLRPDVSGHPRAATPADTSFNQLAEGLLRWSLNALGVGPTSVTLGELKELVAQLAMPEAADTGFTWPNIKGFLANNVHLVVSGTPVGEGLPDESGTPFPMIPVLRWTATGLPDPTEQKRDFTTYRQIDAVYAQEAAACFAELDPAPPADGPTTGSAPVPGRPSESMATFVLRDYFLMVARAMAQEAVNLLTAYPHRISRTDSLQSIAHSHGVLPPSLAVANPDWPVVEGVPITLGALPVQLTPGQTLGALARGYQVDPTALIDPLRDTTPLLRAGATVPLPGFVCAGLPVDRAAAVFYVRLGLTLPTEVPLADWYQTAIERLNHHPVQPPPPATRLRVPAGFQSTDTLSWTTLPGDTVLEVAAYVALLQNVVPGTPFAAWLDAVRAANEPADPAGVKLPAGAAAVVLPNDTLALLQGRLLQQDDQAAFDRYAAAADALVPLVTVEVPGARATTGAGLTLLTLAQKYGLGIEDLAVRIATDPGVLAEQADPPFTVPDVPVMAVEQLLAAMHRGAAIGSVSGQVARFMLGGLRLPAPVLENGAYRATGPMTGGYELIGQQVVGPPPPPQSATDPAVTITVDKAVPADWLAFAEAAVVDGRIRAGAAAADSAVVSITGDDLRTSYPAAGLLPVVRSPLAPLPLSHPVGTRHSVTQVIPWQTTTTVRLPTEPSGPPSLWPLPAELTAQAGADRSASEYLLEQTTPQTGPDVRHSELGSYAWATLVPFAVRRIPGLAGTVEVLGADTADRKSIAQLLEYLRSVPGRPATGAYPAPPPGEQALLTLLWQLPPSPGLGQGLTSTPLDTGATFLVQTNLSTETRSGSTAPSATAGRHVAAIADTERFLTLLWQCSVVGGGGYWMRYHGEVSDAIFDQDGLARFSLLIQLTSQSGPQPDRHLYAFTNLAVVGDGVDPASVALTARAVNPPALHPVATVDPGQLGFTARFANPGDDDSAQGLLRRLYGLFGFQLDRTTTFRASVEGRAVSPKPADGTDELGLLTVSEEAEEVWDLTRVVDISRFAAERTPAVPTAPPSDRDPYAGIAAGALSQVSVRFQDVFGNRSGGPLRIPLPVRYTDPVIGVGSWPATTLHYTVEPAGKLADLIVSIDLQTIAYQPGADAPGLAAAAAAARDRARLAPVHYQISRPDLRAVLLTSLQQREGSEPTPLTADVAVLRRYVIGAHALLTSLTAIGSAPAEGVATLDDLCTGYGVGYDALGTANADAPIGVILDARELAVPVIAAFRNQDTIEGLSRGITTPEQVLLDEDNTVLPLNPAVELTIPAREVPVPAECPPVRQLAAELGCSVTSLVTANQNTPALLQPGFVFDCNGVAVEVGSDVPADAKLTDVAAEYQRRHVPYTAAQVVSLNAQPPGLLRPGAMLRVTGYLVESGDTLRANRAGLTPGQLAPLNTTTVDLFTPGTPVFLTTKATPVPPEETLGAFATDHGTTPGALLRHNGPVPVAAGSPPVVPGMWAWPADPDALRMPCTVRAGDSLDGIAAHFPGADLVEVNAGMPATIAAGVTLTVDGRSVTTTEPVSFDAACELFEPAVLLPALAAALGPRTDVLETGALLVCPPGVLPGAPGTGLTPEQAALPFGVSAAALLAANAGTPGLLIPGQVLHAGPAGRDGTVPTETVAPRDTLTALIERFRRRGVVTGVAAVTEANTTAAFLRAGTRVIVPPATARLTGRLGAMTPAGGVSWSFPEPLFPLTVALELCREPGLVEPALAGTATRAATAVPADRGADPDQDGALTLKAFAERVQRAVPVLRLATAPGRTADTDVWAVVFDTEGIESVVIEPPLEIAGTKQPRTFAIRPMSTTLMARQNVTTFGFDQQTGLPAGEQTRDYQGIDLDVWAQGFLADVELLLSAAYAQGAYALAPDLLDAVIDVKKALAAAVAQGLDHVLDGAAPDGPHDPERAAAVERLRQELLVSLTRGYTTSAVIQYDTSASSPWPGQYARLSGNPVADYGDARAGGRTATLSNGKITLADGDSQITFLVTVPEVDTHASLDLTLDYAGVELEFDIVREVEGYERSDWLTFVTPLGTGSPPALHFDLGSPRVPIPLRAYPPMPILLDQQALTERSPTVLDEALHWRYRCAVQHRSAEQDTVELRVTYNKPAARPTAAAVDDLFSAMARYTEVSTPLLGLLAGLPDWERSDPQRRDTLANALRTYRTLASAVADAWLRHWTAPVTTPPPAPAGTGAPEVEVYLYELGLEVDQDWYSTLKLTRTVETGAGQVGWPETVVCITATGERHELGPQEPESNATTRSYRFPTEPPRVEAFTLLTFELTLPPVHIAAHQNGSAAARVTRNARLLGDGWPQTAQAFVYRTPEAGGTEAVVPFIDVTNAIPIGPWAPPAANPLDPLFRTVFDGDEAGRTIAIGARYAYTLVAADPPVSALLPVVQSTVGAYDPDATVPTLTRALVDWTGGEQPETAGGAWAFRLCLYSSVDTSLQRPLLQLRHLSSALGEA